jgi:hypothetical protein
MLAPQGPTGAILNRHRRGYHIQSSKQENRPLSSFPSAILHFPIVVPSGLILKNLSTIQILKSNPMNQKGIKDLNLMSGTYHSISTVVLSTKNSSAKIKGEIKKGNNAF